MAELLPDLQILGVFDPGTPNQERVVLRPRRRISLAGHAIALGIGRPEGGAYPIYDHIFWFPDLIVEPPAWLFVYTGIGTPWQTQMPNGDPAMTFHWNRTATLFNVPSAVAVAFNADQTEIGRQWATTPQVGSGTK